MNFGLNRNAWTALDCCNGSEWSAVSVRDGTGARPLVLAAGQVSAASPDAERGALEELLSLVDRRLPAIVTLGRDQYRLRVMAAPAVPVREVQATLRWALSSEADNPLEDFNLAWLPIPTEEHLPARSPQIYTVVTPTQWLTARHAAWRQAGMKPKVVDIRETALRNIAGALERPGEGLALLSQDAGGVGMVFTHRGSMYLDRYIESPLSQYRAADASASARLHERVALQLLRSIDLIARSYPFMPVGRVVVAPSPEETGLLQYLSAQLPLPVEALDLSRVFDFTAVPELAASTTMQANCVVPLGAALRRSGTVA
jgi:MSHA biogenesis protein MshI